MTTTTFYLDPENQLHRDIQIDQIREILESETGMLWIDINEPDDQDRQLLLDEFHFHPLVVDIAIDFDTHIARVEDFGSYIFINARSIDYTSEDDIVQTTDLAMFIGGNYVVTAHSVAMPSVEAIKELVEIEGRPMRKGPAIFAHAQFDALIQAILPTLDHMSDRADQIEELILDNPDHSALVALTNLKRSCLSLNRAIGPQREVLSRLGRREFDILGNDADLFFRDLLDDLVRVQQANDAIRERTDTSLATYLSVVGNRQNEIMKVLSIVATVFLPLGLIAGLFGMNFQNMPGLDFRWGYHIVVGVTLLAVSLVAWMFWIKRWVMTGAGFFRRRRLPRFVPSAVEPVRLAGYLGQTIGRNLIRTETAFVREASTLARWRPSVFQRINPAHLRRNPDEQRRTSD